MEFLKRNAFILICLLVGLVSVGLGLVACDTFDAVQKSLDQAADFGTQLAGAGKVVGRKDPIVPRDIEVQKQNKETMQGAIQEALQTALVVNGTGRLDYMVPEAFPAADINDSMHLVFIQKYEAAIRALPTILDAKGPPTQADIDRVNQEIERENEELGIDAKRSGSPAPAAPARDRPVRTDRPRGGMRIQGLPDLTRPPGAAVARPGSRGTPAPGPEAEKPLDEKEQLRRNARRRAELERAASIRCYVDEPNATFSVVTAARDPRVAPDLNAMWEAQMGVWVQREICTALSQVNEEAAKALKVKDPNARVDVTTLPIKRLIRLAVEGYRSSAALESASARDEPAGAGGRPSPARTRRRPPGGIDAGRAGGIRLPAAVAVAEPERPGTGAADLRGDLIDPTWTGREGGEELDVVPVAVQLVMDIRYLPRVIDAICRTNFIVPTRVSYRQLSRADLEGPYVYGPAPVAEVTLAFERYFFPKVYAEKMPPSMHRRLGHRIAEEGERAGRGGRTDTGRRRG